MRSKMERLRRFRRVFAYQAVATVYIELIAIAYSCESPSSKVRRARLTPPSSLRHRQWVLQPRQRHAPRAAFIRPHLCVRPRKSPPSPFCFPARRSTSPSRLPIPIASSPSLLSHQHLVLHPPQRPSRPVSPSRYTRSRPKRIGRLCPSVLLGRRG